MGVEPFGTAVTLLTLGLHQVLGWCLVTLLHHFLPINHHHQTERISDAVVVLWLLYGLVSFVGGIYARTLARTDLYWVALGVVYGGVLSLLHAAILTVLLTESLLLRVTIVVVVVVLCVALYYVEGYLLQNARTRWAAAQRGKGQPPPPQQAYTTAQRGDGVESPGSWSARAPSTTLPRVSTTFNGVGGGGGMFATVV